MITHQVKEELEDDGDLAGLSWIAVRHVGQRHSDDDFLPEDEEDNAQQRWSPVRSVLELETV